jgi:hypothetical protein
VADRAEDTTVQCSQCRGALLGPYSDHALVCPGSQDLSGRHNELCNVVRRHLAMAGCSPRSEPLYLLPGTSRRPGDVFLDSDEDGQPLALDVTVTSPLAATTLQHAAITAGSAAAAAERRKRAQNTADCQAVGIRFLPLAVETFGGWGADALRFFQTVAGRVADRTGQPRNSCFASLFQELAVRLQRGNAHMLLRRAPLLRAGFGAS